MPTIRARLTAGQGRLPTPEVWPYIDSIEVYFPHLKPAQRRRLRRDWRLRRCRRKHHRQVVVFGYKLFCNQRSKNRRKQLTASRLQRLDYLCEKFHGVITRVDVAADIQTQDPEALRLQVRSQAILRWKRSGLMHEIGKTTYWEPLRSGKVLRRNLVLYPAKYNRITGELDCVHLELRLCQAQVIRNQGIRKPSDLLKLNPQEWFNRHVKWSQRAADRQTQSLKAATEKASLKPNSYSANLPKRALSLLERVGLDRSQTYKSMDVRAWRRQNRKEWRTKTSSPFIIPTRLEWKMAEEMVVGQGLEVQLFGSMRGDGVQERCHDRVQY